MDQRHTGTRPVVAFSQLQFTLQHASAHSF